MSQISFFVRGHPATQGSKRGFAIKKNGVYTGQVAMVDSCKRLPGWRESVRNEAEKAWTLPPIEGPVCMRLIFILPRPKWHFGTGKNSSTLKVTAPLWPDGKPDLTKLERAAEDAMKGIIWTDDSRVCEKITRKTFSNDGRIGCLVEIIEIAQSAPKAAA
jgi:crossover junction endodeoxyribonuclease RusA